MSFGHWQHWLFAALLVLALDVMGWIRDPGHDTTTGGFLFARGLLVVALYVLAQLVGWP